MVVLGGVATIYAAGWLLIAWRATRVGEAECTVQLVPGYSWCTVAHRAPDGKEHTVPWQDCDKPTRWPKQPIGTRLHCFYYSSDPDVIFFTPREERWATPERLWLLAIALGVLAMGIVLRLGSQR